MEANSKDSKQKSNKLLIFLIMIHVAFLGIISLNYISINIPILRQILGFIILTFVPGILILNIIQFKENRFIEYILYSIGLSLSVLMLIGLLMNLILPLLGIHNPISSKNVIIVIFSMNIVFTLVAIYKKKYISLPNVSRSNKVWSWECLFLILLPFMSVIGAYLMNSYQNNILLLLMIVFVGILPIFVSMNKLKTKLYPLAIFAASIALILQRSLISTFLMGWDIMNEYYLSNVVITNAFWNTTSVYQSANAMLSITILAPIYSLITDLNIVWCFKIIYPFLFALVPLILFIIFNKQMKNPKLAFFSAFFFLAFFAFYFDMVQLAKQQIAELFLSLLILVLVDKIKLIHKSFLLIIFGFSIIVSHYGLSYLFLFMITFVWILESSVKNLFMKITNKYKVLDHDDWNVKYVSFTLITLLLVFCIAWYMYVNNASTLKLILNVAQNVIININDLFNPQTSEGLSLMQSQAPSFLHAINKYIQLFTQFLILIGLLCLLIKPKIKFQLDYTLFVLSSFILLVLSVALPFFSRTLNTSRVYQITLIFLAPLMVIGWIKFMNIVSNNLNKLNKKFIKIKDYSLNILSIFLLIFLLFNTGVIYEIADDGPVSISLNNHIDYPIYTESEIAGAKWIVKYKEKYSLIYADLMRFQVIRAFSNEYSPFTEKIFKKGYVFIGNYNIMTKNGSISTGARSNVYLNIEDYFNFRNQIYDSGRCEIYE